MKSSKAAASIRPLEIEKTDKKSISLLNSERLHPFGQNDGLRDRQRKGPEPEHTEEPERALTTKTLCEVCIKLTAGEPDTYSILEPVTDSEKRDLIC